MKYTIDAKGKACPQPVVMTMKILDKAVLGDMVEVLVDNEIAVSNLSRLAENRGAGFVSEKTGESEYLVRIRAAEDGTVVGAEEQKSRPDEEKEARGGGPLVAAVCSDKMGEGNDELGHLLIKGFLYALTQLEDLPDTVIFYNGGAKLTVEGSPCLEDLRNLEEQGVEILTCGTCLDFYNLKDKLAVGEVTNMYTIVETLAGAERVIRP